VIRSENQANQLVINRSIKLQMALTDIEFYQLVLHSKLQEFLPMCYSALTIKLKLGVLLSSAERVTKDHC